MASDIQVLSNMMLSYLFSRFGDMGDKADSSPVHYSIPHPSFHGTASAAGSTAAHLGKKDSIGTPRNSEYNVEQGVDNPPVSAGIGRQSSERKVTMEDDESSTSSGFMSPNREYENNSYSNSYEDGKPRSLRDELIKRTPTGNSRQTAPAPRYLSGTTASATKNNRDKSRKVLESSPPAWGAGAGATRKFESEKEFKYYAYKNSEVPKL